MSTVRNISETFQTRLSITEDNQRAVLKDLSRNTKTAHYFKNINSTEVFDLIQRFNVFRNTTKSQISTLNQSVENMSREVNDLNEAIIHIQLYT